MTIFYTGRWHIIYTSYSITAFLAYKHIGKLEINWYIDIVKGFSVIITLSNALPKPMNNFQSMESEAFTWYIHQYDKLLIHETKHQHKHCKPQLCALLLNYLSKPFLAIIKHVWFKYLSLLPAQLFILSLSSRPHTGILKSLWNLWHGNFLFNNASNEKRPQNVLIVIHSEKKGQDKHAQHNLLIKRIELPYTCDYLTGKLPKTPLQTAKYNCCRRRVWGHMK